MFIKLSLLVVSSYFVAGNTQAAESKISFESLMHDFGKVKRGEKLSHTFTFKNIGDDLLMITGVHTACGCAVSQVDVSRAFKPNETGTVEVTLDTSNFSGSLVKTVTVMSNEKLMPTRNLTLKAMVEEEYSAEPPVLDLGEVSTTESLEKVVKIVSHTGKEWKVGTLRYNQAILSARTEQKGQDVLVFIKLQPGVGAGFIKETLYVKTPGAVMQELPILIRADVKGSIRIASSYVEFGSLQGSEGVRRDIRMQRTGAFKVESTTADLNINGVKVANVADFIKTEFTDDTIGVNLSNTKGARGSVHGRLTLHTNDPAQKQLSVDFYAFFNPS